MTDLGSIGLWVAVAPVVLGGVLGFAKPLLIREQDLENRVALHKQALIEKVAQRLTTTLAFARDANDISELRGNPPHSPDIVGDLTVELIRVLAVVRQLKGVRTAVRRCYSLLLGCFGLAFMGLVAVLVYAPARVAVFVSSVALLAVEFAIVCAIRHSQARLSQYEETT